MNRIDPNQGKQIAMVAEQLKKAGPMRERLRWEHPSTETIWSKTKESSESGSPEDWHGLEVKYFPDGVADYFRWITER